MCTKMTQNISCACIGSATFEAPLIVAQTSRFQGIAKGFVFSESRKNIFLTAPGETAATSAPGYALKRLFRYVFGTVQ